MSIDLEYAIKQDIRNNPVVREVDLEQRREFFRTIRWAALAVGTVMFALWPRTNLQETRHRIETLREQLAQEEAANRQYQLELETLLGPTLLRPRAQRELLMDTPDVRHTLVLPVRLDRTPASRAIVAAVR